MFSFFLFVFFFFFFIIVFFLFFFFFFFQAEDGIRDTSVTGVQTCALPIYSVLVFIHRQFHPSACPPLYRRAAVRHQERNRATARRRAVRKFRANGQLDRKSVV